MLPKVDLSDIADELKRLGDEIQRAYDDSEQTVEPAPQVSLSGFAQLLDAVRAGEAEPRGESAQVSRPVTGAEPEALLEHGLGLLRELGDVARRLSLESQAQAVEVLAVPFACWMLRRGGELQHPEDVVNALAILANRLSRPEELAELYGLMGEIAEGIGADRVQGMDPTDPTDPWLVLLINRGIVATRSQQPALMEESFAAIGEQLPDHAPNFFREGMGQMEALNYPAPVREVMQRYFDKWCSGQRLH
ncbi:hypothetical protein [Thiocapsa bogorovii]|uniref:hypothetical protein n=1 Tax=Thiocapsa bogorovii TaxID=521689 RepID=UPI001E355B1E|nr:hypothetical protein [Thiocapsa bogorovii]UHD17190.1 hypothetical protein LT988_03805 [Thiocapsa bogorovii]